MRSVMLNAISLAAGLGDGWDSVGGEVECTGVHESAGPGRFRRQVIAGVVAAVAGDLLVGLLVDEHFFGRTQLARAIAAAGRPGEPTQLPAAALLLLGRDRIAERIRLRARAGREAERVDLRNAGLTHERERPLERGLVLGR